MRFSPVCPIHIYEALDRMGPQYLGDYFLLLAHDVLANRQRYHDFFYDRPCTKIMDNSVIELGTACTAQALFDACQTVNATVVVIPDELEKGVATFEKALTFLHDWEALPHAGRYEKMYVPQGSTLADYMFCLEQGMERFLPDIQWIGVARNLTTRLVPTRRMIVGYIDSMLYVMNKPNVQIHMLGYSNDVHDDITTCRMMRNMIQGIDSAVPLRMGSNNQIVKTYVHADPGPRGNWWETVTPNDLMFQNVLTTRSLLGEYPHALRS